MSLRKERERLRRRPHRGAESDGKIRNQGYAGLRLQLVKDAAPSAPIGSKCEIGGEGLLWRLISSDLARNKSW